MIGNLYLGIYIRHRFPAEIISDETIRWQLGRDSQSRWGAHRHGGDLPPGGETAGRDPRNHLQGNHSAAAATNRRESAAPSSCPRAFPAGSTEREVDVDDGNVELARWLILPLLARQHNIRRRQRTNIENTSRGGGINDQMGGFGQSG